jgi:hypothetical protein
MNRIIVLAVLAVMLCAAQFVQAVPRGGKRGPNGVQGTISTVGSKGFAMTTKDGKTVDVLCDGNTKFLNGKDAATASDIKEGVSVTVQGGMNGTQMMATSVTIMPSRKKK